MKKLATTTTILYALAVSALAIGATTVASSEDVPNLASTPAVAPRVAFEQHLAANAAEAQRQADVEARQIAERQAQIAERQAKLNEVYRVAAEAIAEATEAGRAGNHRRHPRHEPELRLRRFGHHVT